MSVGIFLVWLDQEIYYASGFDPRPGLDLKLSGLRKFFVFDPGRKSKAKDLDPGTPNVFITEAGPV